MVEQCAPGTRWHARAKEIPEAPALMLGLEPYYRAFWALNGSRQLGMGAGPIAWSEVEAYGRARRFGWEQREDLHAYISVLDGVYLEHVAKQKPRSHGDKPQPGKLRAPNPKGRGGHRARGR